jgi:hypothetical protein
MRTLRQSVVALLVFMLAAASPALAGDRHAVPPSALSQAVSSHSAAAVADRAEVHDVLRDVAAKAGFDLDRLNASIDTMDGDALTQVAAAAQQVDQSLVGGASTVVISTTTIIIALLVLILIIVAV